MPRARPTPNRPADWRPPGPAPCPPPDATDLEPADDETLSYLTGDFRIFQKKVGHRWSLDDFLTAYVAIGHAPEGGVARAFDLGCGIGSVMMMVGWAFPEATLRGVEAQALSHALALRSVRYNGLAARCEVTHGDLRDVPAEPSFDLVTGTPPYIPLGSGLVSPRNQREPCFFETLGGFEDYALTAARLLRPGGRFVACLGPWPPDRGERAAEAAGLAVRHVVDCVPRAGKPVLFRVVVAERASRSPEMTPPTRAAFEVRDCAGEITEQMHVAREVMGQPPLQR